MKRIICICIVILIIIIVAIVCYFNNESINKNNSNNIKNQNIYNNSLVKSVEEKEWEDKEVTGKVTMFPPNQFDANLLTSKFYHLNVLDFNYLFNENSNYIFNNDCDIENVSDFLCASTIQNDNEIINANIYKVKDISEKCAVVVKFETEENYYIYINIMYKPNMLKDLIEDLNIKNSIIFNRINYKYFITDISGELKQYNIEFDDINNDVNIWNILFSNQEISNNFELSELSIGNYNEINGSEISIKTESLVLAYENLGFTVTSKGYLLCNILGTGKAFYIGEEKFKELSKYLANNCEGYNIIVIIDD